MFLFCPAVARWGGALARPSDFGGVSSFPAPGAGGLSGGGVSDLFLESRHKGSGL